MICRLLCSILGVIYILHYLPVFTFGDYWSINLSIPLQQRTMASEQMLKPVYLRNRDIQSNKGSKVTDFDLANAVGKSVNDIKCIQLDRDLWRIYVHSRESRQTLISEGFELRNKTISVFDTNPYSAGTEKPDEEVVRVTVKGVPLSVDDDCIVKMLSKLGAKLTSDIKYEKIRNPATRKMTDILNGNRFVYMQPMEEDKFLPRTSFCAGLRCTIFHNGQPKRTSNILCSNCWGDDHLRHQCEYEACCKVCREPGHKPGSNQCKYYDGKQKDILAFSGSEDVLSNFFPCEINAFGMIHDSAEHAFQYSKAMRSGDTLRAAKIREAPTALDAKRIGGQVMVSDQWLDTQEKVMSDVIESKFKQVKEFQEKLMSIDTKTVTIVEAAYDDVWGAGLDKNGTLKTAMKHWPGKNGLGKLFMNIVKSRKYKQPQTFGRGTRKSQSAT